MHTAEIGTDEPSAQTLAPLHVISDGLGLESRVEAVGSGSTGIFHARSFTGSRRVVLVYGPSVDAGLAMSDALDQLSDLPLAEIVHSINQCLSKQHSKPPLTQISMRVLRIDKRAVEWVGYGRAPIHRQRKTQLFGSSTEAHLGEGVDLVKGVCHLLCGDDVIVWVGGALVDDRLIALFAESPGARAQCLQDSGANGCLATFRRL